MRWHVNCFTWLMLFTIFAGGVERIELKNSRKPVKRSVNQFDEVADFADVIEPANNEQPVRREVRPSLFERSEPAVDKFDTSSSSNTAPKKRSVSRKYSNLLDLKYYYSRGLPVRRHLNFDAPSKEDKRHTVENEEGEEKKSDETLGMGVDGKSKRNSPLNILPVMSDQNPYMSGLADATNDAYLKMRNYAATMMVILTTTRKPQLRLNDAKVLSSSESVKSMEVAKVSQPIVPSISSTIGISEERKIGQARDISAVLRKHKRKQRNPTKSDSKGEEKNRRIIKKDVFSFVNKLNPQPATLQVVSNIPVVDTVPVANVPVADNVPLSVVNAAPVVKAIPIQEAAISDAQSYIPAVATVTRSDSNQKNSVLDSNNQAPANAIVKHFEGAPVINPTHNQQVKHLDTIKSHPMNAAPPRPHLAALSKPIPIKQRPLKDEKKETTENPFLWENNLLKEANIKVKRTMKPQETVLENQGRIAADERKDIPLVTDTKNIEISSKMLTSPPSTANAASSCIINKSPESDDEQCNEEDDEVEEDCGMEAMVNNTCGGLSPEAKKRRQADSADKQPVAGLATSRKLRLARNANNGNFHTDQMRASPDKEDPTHNKAHNTNSHSNNRNRLSWGAGAKSKKQICCGLMFSINKSLAETNDNFSTTTTTIVGDNLTTTGELQKEKVASKIVMATTPLARLIEIPTLSFGLKGLGHTPVGKGRGKNATVASSSKGKGKKHKVTSKEGKLHKKVTLAHLTTEYVAEKQIMPLDFDARRLHKHKGKARAKGTKAKSKSQNRVTSEKSTMTKGKQASKIVASTTPFAQLKEIPTLGFAAVLYSTTSTPESSNAKDKSVGGGVTATTITSSTITSTTITSTSSTSTYTGECIVVPKNVANAEYKNDLINNERIQRRH